MPVKKHKQIVKVVKIPLRRDERPPDRRQNFPPMPRLYLEIVENKAKIRQELINTEYVPGKTFPFHSEQRSPESYKQKSISEKFTPDSSDVDISSSDSDSDSDFEKRFSKYDLSDSSSNSDSDSISVQTKDTDDISVRLKELLQDTDDDSGISESFGKFRSRKYGKKNKSIGFSDLSAHSTPFSKYSPMKHAIPQGVPPTLGQLQNQGVYQNQIGMPNVNMMNDQETMDKKRELLFKFDILKKSYPLASNSIDEFTIHSDLGAMQKGYDDSVRRLSLDSTVENYKKYLVMGFYLTEYIFGNFLGFDMQGFSNHQILNMTSYNRLLIELGEKSYVPTGSKWPVELRLIGMIIINAVIFIVGRMVMRSTGSNMMNMFNKVNQTQSPQAPPPSKKKKMAGPDIPDFE